MNYFQCQRYLQEIQSLGIRLGLDRVKTVLFSLNNPHQKYPSVLVAGTNGKGSVCAMLAQILMEHGIRVGLYTSPHLVKLEERICIGKDLISPRDFCQSLTAVKRKVDELLKAKRIDSLLTHFELLTCVAFLYFARRKIDIAVLEVGMGGRFDATNVVTPLVSVITTISRDHQEFLGEKLSQIAFEKAGIIKPGIPVVCGESGKQAFRVIWSRARELHAPFFGVFHRPGCFKVRKQDERYRFYFKYRGLEYEFSPSLLGEHQGRNGAVAVAAASLLSQSWRALSPRKIVQGIERVKWEGRLEIASRKPLIILDGAHNLEGAKILKSYIQDFIPGSIVLIFAVMKDKEIKKIADILFPLAKRIILTTFPYSRAASPQEIKARALRFQKRIILEPETKRALKMAVAEAGPQGSVVVTGSLFLVGEVKKVLRGR